MAKVTFDLESNAQPVIDDWKKLNSTGEELNKTTEEFGDISKKSFKEAADASDDFSDSLKNNQKEEKKGIDNIDSLKKSLNELSTARDKSTDTKKIVEFNKKIDEGEKKVKQLTNAGKEGFDEMGNSIEETTNKFGGILDIAGGFGLAFGIDALIGGIIDVGSAVIDTVGEFRTLRGEVQTLTGLTDEALDSQIEGAKAIAATFDVEVNEVIKTANVLSREFGLTQEEALDKVRQGALGVAGDTGELIEQTKEYASQIRAAGGDADTLFNIINKSAQEGIFSDKGIDVVKEFGLRIREQTSATGDALDAAFGEEFTDQIFDGINDGSLTSIQALEQISEKMNDTSIPAKELQTVIADVFGGAGEDAGLAYLQTLTDLSGSVDGLIDKTNVLTQSQIASLEAEERLAQVQNDLSKLFDDESGNTFFTNLQAVGFQLLIGVIEPLLGLFDVLKGAFSPLIDAVSELGSTVFGAGESFSILDIILTPIQIAFEVIGFVLGLVAQGLTFVINGINDFVKSSPVMTAAIEFIGAAIDKLVEQFRVARDFITSGFDIQATQAQAAARRIDAEFTQPLLAQLETISSAERDVEKQRVLTHQNQLKRNLEILSGKGLLTSAIGIELIEQSKANKIILDEIQKQEDAEVKVVEEGEKEKQEVRDVANKEAGDKQKNPAEDRLKELKKIQDDFRKAVERAATESAKIELDNLEGPEKFAKLKDNALLEIKILEDTIREKGRLFQEERTRDIEIRNGSSKEQIEAAVKEAGDLFELTQEQSSQLAILRNDAREKELTAIMEFENEKKLARLGDEGERLDVQEDVAVEGLEDLERVDTDFSIVDFELFKQEELLRIQEEFALKRIALLEEEIDAKIEIAQQDGSISIAEQNEIDRLNLAKENLNDFVEEARDAQDELAKERGKFSMAEFLGVSNEDLAQIKQSLNTLIDATVQALDGILNAQADALDERIDMLEEQEDTLRDELDTELALNEQGFASNVEGKRAELEALKIEKEKAQKDAESLAKKQFILDTAVQASSIITASANILKGFSTIPFVGQVLGLAAVATMIGGFIAARTAAFGAISGGSKAATGASGKGKTGKVHGNYHSQGGEGFTDHLEVEKDEAWSILNRGATSKHEKAFHEFAKGLNSGKSPDDLMREMLHGTGVYMKGGIDKQISSRGIVVRQQEIIMMNTLGNDSMAKSMDNVDKNLSDLKTFEMNKKQYITKPNGRIEIDPVSGKKTHINYLDDGKS